MRFRKEGKVTGEKAIKKLLEIRPEKGIVLQRASVNFLNERENFLRSSATSSTVLGYR